jgi:protoheme IX farnesyltransferase
LTFVGGESFVLTAHGLRPAKGGVISTVAAYVQLTKPRIIELLLVTTVPAMFLAAGGVPPLGLTVATLVGGTLAAGSANALNCYFDRDIDAVMRRTAMRPLARDVVDLEVTPRAALVFGLVLGFASVLLLSVTTNPLATALAVVAIVVYVLGYTLGLKRRTPQNIVWGGAAGCIPVLIGWAAVTGSLSWPAVLMFLVVFFWTPPHFWALAMRFREDYAAAGVPMLPVVASPRSVVNQMTAHTWAMVGCSLLLGLAPGLGVLYLGTALVLDALFVREVYRFRRCVLDGQDGKPMRVFHYSITYLTTLSVVIVVAVLV